MGIRRYLTLTAPYGVSKTIVEAESLSRGMRFFRGNSRGSRSRRACTVLSNSSLARVVLMFGTATIEEVSLAPPGGGFASSLLVFLIFRRHGGEARSYFRHGH